MTNDRQRDKKCNWDFLFFGLFKVKTPTFTRPYSG